MSLNACEAYLLELRKDEIWQLLYVQRQSEGEAYETLARKGLAWLGEQRFRDAITRWEREESEEYIRLHDGASGSFSGSLEGFQLNHQWAISDSPHAQGHEPITLRSQPSRAPILLEEATLVSMKGSDTSAEPYSELPFSTKNSPSGGCYQEQSLTKGLERHDERPETPIGNWLLNTPLRSNFPNVAKSESFPTVPNSLSQARYTSGVAAICPACGEDNSSLPIFLHDANSSYTERGSAVQPASKPVSHIFGYIVSPVEDEEDSESESEDKHQDNEGFLGISLKRGQEMRK